jgi:hypothetical protein
MYARAATGDKNRNCAGGRQSGGTISSQSGASLSVLRARDLRPSASIRSAGGMWCRQILGLGAASGDGLVMG